MIGIIDAEAHVVNFFGPKQILAVSKVPAMPIVVHPSSNSFVLLKKVCHDLGEIELGI